MKNKVLVHFIVPDIDEDFDAYVPISIRVGLVIDLLNKALVDLSKGTYQAKNSRNLYGKDAKAYELNKLVRETDIRNGSVIVFM